MAAPLPGKLKGGLSESLLDRFAAEELNDYVRGVLSAELKTRKTGRRRFTFNVFDVVLDMDSRTATIDDVLEADSTQSVPLVQFQARIP